MLSWRADRRADLGPVGDQGLRLTCLAWALSTSHHHIAALGEFPSVEYLHWASGNYVPGRGRIPSAAEAIRLEGQPPQSQWPYQHDIDETDGTYGPPGGSTGPFDRAALRPSSATVADLEHELLNGNCPVVGLRVTDEFLSAPGGLVTADGPGVDGHAVVVTSIADYNGPADLPGVPAGSRLICVRNSWGTSWGVDGDALITQEAFELIAVGAVVVEPFPAGQSA